MYIEGLDYKEKNDLCSNNDIKVDHVRTEIL